MVAPRHVGRARLSCSLNGGSRMTRWHTCADPVGSIPPHLLTGSTQRTPCTSSQAAGGRCAAGRFMRQPLPWRGGAGRTGAGGRRRLRTRLPGGCWRDARWVLAWTAPLTAWCVGWCWRGQPKLRLPRCAGAWSFCQHDLQSCPSDGTQALHAHALHACTEQMSLC